MSFTLVSGLHINKTHNEHTFTYISFCIKRIVSNTVILLWHLHHKINYDLNNVLMTTLSLEKFNFFKLCFNILSQISSYGNKVTSNNVIRIIFFTMYPEKVVVLVFVYTFLFICR